MSATEVSAVTFTPQNLTESRALELLGAGFTQAQTASAIGVEESRISQLMAREDFRAAVSEKKYAALNKHNKMDEDLDRIESKLTARLEKVLPLMLKPEQVMKGLQIVNAAKRRGAGVSQNVAPNLTVIALTIPQRAITQFAKTAENTIVEIDGTSLLPLQSSKMSELAKNATPVEIKREIPNEHSTVPFIFNSAEQPDPSFLEQPRSTKAKALRIQQEISAEDI